MNRNSMFAGAALAGALALPTAALADMAVATTDVNLRLGPGPEYQVVSVVPGLQTVTIHDCTPSLSWCEVSYGTQTGWVYARYLDLDDIEETVVIAGPDPRPAPEYRTVAPDRTGLGLTTGAAGGAITGAIIGGPVGAAIGGVAGATLGGVFTAPAHARTYAVEQPVEPVYVEREVVVGGTLPDRVTLHPIPDYDYRFAHVNERRVIVEPHSRQIVHIVR